ncbi:hypothetical protein DEO72_LG8g1208 [Vigna unguiculata]|uniref:Uncharacterized protein n=1 Tax=Vigna unguiculata TaxID=3917 RepID=A0A4D6MP39_VIGUN|nr:hypothetical protein DEO72_LG8g1208 [Vigna unguiculata]
MREGGPGEVSAAVAFTAGMAWTMVCTNLVKMQKRCCAFPPRRWRLKPTAAARTVAGASMAVSYTHLDVYKRQPWSMPFLQNGMDHGVHEAGEDAETVLCVSAEKMEVETYSCCADSPEAENRRYGLG